MISSATIIGRTHRLMQQNCHDFACTGNPVPGHIFGFVLDGCGGKYREGKQIAHPHSEVGAKLLGRFAANYLTQRLMAETLALEPSALLNELYVGCLHFMGKILDSLLFVSESERVRFIASHLLCTFVGLLVLPETAMFFWSGDGFLCRNGVSRCLESHNKPEYLGYHLLPNHMGKGDNSNRFEMEPIKDLGKTCWLAVATDGWSEDQMRDLAPPRSGLALQRWLNKQGRKRGCFEDDGAVVVWWNNRQPDYPSCGSSQSSENR